MSEATFKSLEDKMVPEIDSGHPYEALQLAESFIARKKKSVGRDETSSLVFHGAKLLVDGNASADAGSLLAWYIEDGAGDDYYFRLKDDLPLLAALIGSLPPEKSYPILQKIYGPIHKIILKQDVKTLQTLSSHLNSMELNWIDIFIAAKDWNTSVKALLRLDNTSRAADILHRWGTEAGIPSEYALYFARAVLVLLADGLISRALALLRASQKYLDPMDNEIASATEELSDAHAAVAPSLAVWHVAIIATELADSAPKPRVDKNKIYLLLLERYGELVERLDPKLNVLLHRVGQTHFGMGGGDPNSTNPMAAMFQSMMSGPPPASQQQQISQQRGNSGPQPSLGGMDVNTMMEMLARLQK